jgi:hypothetical protein
MDILNEKPSQLVHNASGEPTPTFGGPLARALKTKNYSTFPLPHNPH